MKKLSLAFAIFSIVPAAAHAKCSDVNLADAQRIYEHAADGANRGIVGLNVALEAKLLLQDLQECAGTISKADYCKGKNSTLDELEATLKDFVQQGKLSSKVLMPVLSSRVDLDRFCR